MVKELWGSFPRLIERNINSLIDEAYPNPVKAFHIYKSCRREDLWSGNFEGFSKCLQDFFSQPKSARRKGAFDRYLRKPMQPHVFNQFNLDFRTGMVSDKSIYDVASWAHHLIRVSRKTVSAVISLDILSKTIRNITNPGPLDKAENIEFEDFCSAWKKTVFKIFGKKHDAELNSILAELHLINIELKEVEKHSPQLVFPTVYLTQTEVDWVLAVKDAVSQNRLAPKFPLSRGPQKQALIDLERAATLFNLSFSTTMDELLKHRENVRTTIRYRCDRLVQVNDAA